MFSSSKIEKIAYQSLFVLFIIFLLFCFLFFPKNNDLLEVTFLKIEKGDAIFIKTPNNHKILIDGGSDNTVLAKIGSLMPFFDRKFDLIFLTHPHADHLDGLIEVLKKYKTNLFLYSVLPIGQTGLPAEQAGATFNSPDFLKFTNLIQKKKISLKEIQKDQKIKLDEIEIEILSPSKEDIENKTFQPNDLSLVLKLKYQKVSFLFMADAGRPIEEKLIEEKVDLESSILKIGHSGSKTASDKSFLKKVNPKIAVISVGENTYGHPHPWTLESLNDLKIKTFRTDKDGDIKIISDGEKIEVKLKCR